MTDHKCDLLAEEFGATYEQFLQSAEHNQHFYLHHLHVVANDIISNYYDNPQLISLESIALIESTVVQLLDHLHLIPRISEKISITLLQLTQALDLDLSQSITYIPLCNENKFPSQSA